MTQPAHIKIASLAALYLLWLATWLVFGNEFYGAARHYWSQATAAAITGLVAFYVARRTPRPYPGFLVMQGVAFLLLAVAWITYPASSEACHIPMLSPEHLSIEQCSLISNAIYALCVFALLCAWSYLALETWYGRPLSSFTMLVFAILMLGLGAIFAGFYYNQYAGSLSSLDGRLYVVTAALEFSVLVAGLFCMLLRVPAVVVWLLVGTAILIAGDMGYSVDSALSADYVPPIIDAVWMLGQILLLSSVVVMPEALIRDGLRPEPIPHNKEESYERSGLSGILILISLGAVLLSPLVWFLPVDTVWKSFFAVLFVISLVVILVRITDRFDDTVAYLRSYVRRVHQSRLVSEDWRGAPSRIRRALQSTGLGAFVEEFRDSAAHLKQNVLFLGPERLYGAPKDYATPRKASCFIVMPFSQEWSADVHRILASACEAVGVRPVRGDDLFTPTDILEDIWQSINAADFVIADITGRNPNVLYEMGIAHTLAKPVLILSRQASDIPVDLATRRVILYGQTGEDWHADLAHKISAAIAALAEDYGLTKRQQGKPEDVVG
jgi:hypothetical protein